jgi:acyl-CoA thioesterase FadM
LKAAKIGDNILVKAVTDRVGKNLAFLNVQIVNKQSGAILVQGSFL